MGYPFVAEHRALFLVRALCRCLRIQPSGFYAWLKNPLSRRAKEDAWWTRLVQQTWEESGKVYGHRKLHDDLLDQGDTCCPNRVARLASLAGIKARIGYKRKPSSYGGNTLARQFEVAAPGKAWVTNITYFMIIGWGWMDLSTALDESTRYIIAWNLCPNMRADDVTNTFDIAVAASGGDSATLLHNPSLLSDNGPSYIAREMAEYLEVKKTGHGRSAPMHR